MPTYTYEMILDYNEGELKVNRFNKFYLKINSKIEGNVGDLAPM